MKCGFLFVISLLLPVSVLSQDNVYTWAVVPQFSSVVTHEKWAPFLAQLSENHGMKVKLQTYADFQSFEEDLLSGIPDFIYLNPFHAVMAKKVQNYTPIVRDGEKVLTGILVTRKDSGIREIPDLQGKSIAFPAPAAFGASLYMRALLIKEYNITFRTIYVGSHSNAYRATLVGRTEAGGGVERTLEAENEQVRDGLKIIFRTPGAIPHPVVAHPRVPKKVIESVIDFFFTSTRSRRGQEMLSSIQIGHPVRSDYNRDYANLEKLQLENFIKN